uniref:Uncharacterized protein n=1 Tax=Knipowitschia caucasica TaxID=637954 RepID=A0AAV2MM12_KNICA
MFKSEAAKGFDPSSIPPADFVTSRRQEGFSMKRVQQEHAASSELSPLLLHARLMTDVDDGILFQSVSEQRATQDSCESCLSETQSAAEDRGGGGGGGGGERGQGQRQRTEGGGAEDRGGGGGARFTGSDRSRGSIISTSLSVSEHSG